MSGETEAAAFVKLAQRFSDARTMLLSRLPFYGFMLMRMDLRVGDAEILGINSAAVTKDRKIYFNLEWSAKLTDAEFVGVLLHELLHLTLGFFMRLGVRDFKKANGAHDHVVNLQIEELREFSTVLAALIALPKPNLCDPKYKGLSFEEVYALLSDDAGEDGGQWGLGDIRPDLGDSEDDAKLDRELRQLIIEASLHQEKAVAGCISSGMEQVIHEILNPRVPWQDVLSQWVGQHGKQPERSYRRLDRRAQAMGYVSPSSFKSGVCDVVVLWDTSGSMAGRETEILSEILGICEDLGLALRVICCDYGICSDQENVRHPEEIAVKGGGGSDFRPAFDRLDDEQFTGIVVAFTDGVIQVPAEMPLHLRGVLWVIWKRDQPPARWGDSVIVDKDGMAKKRA